MKKFCKQCGKEFLTEYPTKLYCSLKCANAAYFEREESDYKYLPETAEPFFIFNCAECGKEVKIYSKYDQRHTTPKFYRQKKLILFCTSLLGVAAVFENLDEAIEYAEKRFYKESGVFKVINDDCYYDNGRNKIFYDTGIAFAHWY